MGRDEDISINMPSAPMPMPEGDATASMHPAFVTQLAGSKPYYMKGGLIPHLTKKGTLLEEHSSSHSYDGVEVSTLH